MNLINHIRTGGKGNLFQKVFVLSAVFSIGLSGACLADIRPDQLKKQGMSAENVKKGREILNRLPAAYGGKAAWMALSNSEVVYTDQWIPVLIRAVYMPWYKDKQLVKQTWKHGTDNSRLIFLEEPNKGETWGLQNWAAYSIAVGKKKIAFEKDDPKNLKFWLPTMQYFFEAPFRLDEATVVAYAGERKVQEQTYDLVFASWGKAGPQNNIDQYIIWVNRKTGLMDYLQYTVREMGFFVTGTMRYRNLKKVNGLLYAHEFTVVDKVGGDDVLHQMIVKSIEHNKDYGDSFFVPSPKMAESKFKK